MSERSPKHSAALRAGRCPQRASNRYPVMTPTLIVAHFPEAWAS